MDIGFTGTRERPTLMQQHTLRAYLIMLRKAGAEALHHGDCVNGDEVADLRAMVEGYRIVIHPPTDEKLRAHCERRGPRFVCRPEPYLIRNRSIVNATSLLVAMPYTQHEEIRSGTWSTVRYARNLGRPIIILFPDGKVTLEAIDALVQSHLGGEEVWAGEP